DEASDRGGSGLEPGNLRDYETPYPKGFVFGKINAAERHAITFVERKIGREKAEAQLLFHFVDQRAKTLLQPRVDVAPVVGIVLRPYLPTTHFTFVHDGIDIFVAVERQHVAQRGFQKGRARQYARHAFMRLDTRGVLLPRRQVGVASEIEKAP